MAIPFKSPLPKVRLNYNREIQAVDNHANKRGVPQKQNSKLLLATWNIANLGVQNRTDNALKIIAHIMAKFDLIAVQEVNEKFLAFKKVVDYMGSHFNFIMTDTAGNSERLAFVYDTRKVEALNLFGELALRPREYPKRNVTVHYRKKRQDRKQTFRDVKFVPFDRNPYIGTFKAGSIGFTLVNTHLYFGKFGNSSKEADRKKYARRVLEIFALSKWADRRLNRPATYDRDIILMGDMNVPAMVPTNSAYGALIEFGFQPLKYTSKVGGSNLGNDKTYDQMAFAPGTISNRIKDLGIFDFDKAVLRHVWEKLEGQKEARKITKSKMISKFSQYVKYHISDHRPLWVELDIS